MSRIQPHFENGEIISRIETRIAEWLPSYEKLQADGNAFGRAEHERLGFFPGQGRAVTEWTIEGRAYKAQKEMDRLKDILRLARSTGAGITLESDDANLVIGGGK